MFWTCHHSELAPPDELSDPNLIPSHRTQGSETLQGALVVVWRELPSEQTKAPLTVAVSPTTATARGPEKRREFMKDFGKAA